MQGKGGQPSFSLPLTPPIGATTPPDAIVVEGSIVKKLRSAPHRLELWAAGQRQQRHRLSERRCRFANMTLAKLVPR